MIERALFGWHHRAVHVPRVRRVAGALARAIGGAESVLDVGCGDGTVARHVAAAVGATRVAGVDVKVRPDVAIEVTAYDGLHLPFEDDAFEAVLIADVLHHCVEPLAVLREALRVARRVVAVKDHFRFGAISNGILYAMDRVGNAAPGVHVTGTYFSPSEWIELVHAAGGHVARLEWPLQIHDYPFRLVTGDELQFAAAVLPLGGAKET